MDSNNEGKVKEGIYEETDVKEKTFGGSYVSCHADGTSDRMRCFFYGK